MYYVLYEIFKRKQIDYTSEFINERERERKTKKRVLRGKALSVQEKHAASADFLLHSLFSSKSICREYMNVLRRHFTIFNVNVNQNFQNFLEIYSSKTKSRGPQLICRVCISYYLLID